MPSDPFDSSADSALAALVPGLLLLGRFEMIAFSGKGGMGVVWRARDRSLDQDVALKFIPSLVASDSISTSELRREAKRARNLTHPYICRVHDYAEDPERGLAWISMEYLPGDSLTRRLRGHQRGFFEVGEIQHWAGQLCDALTYAHERAGLVHRDLKPSNLLLDARGDVKVSDFGIAQTISESVTRLTGMMAPSGTSGSGTPLYMSPQQARGDRPRATDDLYSLGATLFELLAGRPPFFTGDLNYQRQHVPAPTVAERRRELHHCEAPVPENWEVTIHRLLAKFPEHRPQSAREVAEALKPRPGASRFGGSEFAGTPGEALGPPKPSAGASATNPSLSTVLPPARATAHISTKPAPRAAAKIPSVPPLPTLGTGFESQLPPAGQLGEPGHPRAMSAPASASPHFPNSKAWLWWVAILAFLVLVVGGVGFAFFLAGRNSERILRIPGRYRTIQGAIDAAKAGDTVRVAPGTYREYIRLRNDVALEGEDPARCVLELADNAPSVIRADRVTGARVSGFTILGRGLTQATLYSLGFTYDETADGGVKVKSVGEGGPPGNPRLPIGAKLVSIDGEPVPYWENIVALTARWCAPRPTAVVYFERGNERTVTLTTYPQTFGGYFLQGIVLRESQADITRCTMRGIAGPSIVALGTSCRGELAYNTITECGSTGIVVSAAGDGLTIRGNTIEQCKGNGIEISGASASIVTRNVSRRNQQAGIAILRQGTIPEIIENTCEWNQRDGLLFQTGAGGTARANQLRNNEQNGIFVAGEGTSPLISSNIATANRKFGIAVAKAARAQIGEGNQWTGNTGGAVSR